MEKDSKRSKDKEPDVKDLKKRVNKAIDDWRRGRIYR